MQDLSKKILIQVSQYYWPQRGGQEQIIDYICKYAENSGRLSLVIQPFTLGFLRLSNYRKYSVASGTYIIPLIGFFTPVLFMEKIYNIIFHINLLSNDLHNYLSEISFSCSLYVTRLFLKIFNSKSIIIFHYHTNQLYLNPINSIIFSHGIDWSRPAKIRSDIYKIKNLKKVLINNKYSKIIANDNDFLRYIDNLGPQKYLSEKCKLIINPVDTKIFFRADGFQNKLELKKIVMIRNIRKDRGILEGIEAFKIFNKNKKDWILNIYGYFNLSDLYYNSCMMAAGADLGSSIFFKGPVNHSSVPDILKMTTISMVPSIAMEGSSLSALEAMASGVVCVSTNIGGLADLPTIKAISIEPLDIADALFFAVDNYSKVQNSQYLYTTSHFSLSRWHRQFEEVILEIEK